MKNFNLIPIGIYIPEDEGMTDAETNSFEQMGKDIFAVTGSFNLLNELETESCETLGVFAPASCINYLKDHDEMIIKIIEYGFEELVSFLYWCPEYNEFHVKHPTGEVVPFELFVETLDETDEILNKINEEIYEDPSCDDCEFQDECDELNIMMEVDEILKMIYKNC